MNIKEFYEFMEQKLPVEWRLDGDYDGMSCCPDPLREAKKVLIALDATADIVDEAVSGEYDLILTHHPMLFGGVRDIISNEYRSNKLIKLIKNNISVMSFHTRLDAAPDGVNDTLAQLIGLKSIEAFGEKGLGRIGTLEIPMFANDLAEFVKTVLGAPYVEYSDGGKLIYRVAVCGGSASSLIKDAMAVGADALLGGELGYHNLTDSSDYGLTLIAAGHFYSENPVCAKLFELALEAGAEPTMAFSNRIEVV